ncbi:MAG: flagellar biosynthesis anti-sigma factor FlgM [Sedimentisphaerales bacterium]|nr:flagellar biosynthesis anti-sigma factor FlgM [Sedimentisphaerales bacterium]
MLNYDCKSSFEDRNRFFDSLCEDLRADQDLVMEQILENIHKTPIGQVLKKIASLPEVRRNKVLDVRRRLTEGRYDLNERLDFALEKVLEDLVT